MVHSGAPGLTGPGPIQPPGVEARQDYDGTAARATNTQLDLCQSAAQLTVRPWWLTHIHRLLRLTSSYVKSSNDWQ